MIHFYFEKTKTSKIRKGVADDDPLKRRLFTSNKQVEMTQFLSMWSDFVRGRGDPEGQAERLLQVLFLTPHRRRSSAETSVLPSVD